MTTMTDNYTLAAQLGQILQQRQWLLTTAESCTGGLVAELVTAIPGSSAWFERGFVTYSNAAKIELLGVPAHIIAEQGAVSEATARAMAEGAIRHSPAQVSIAITGIAGPGGETADKPVGTVWHAWVCPNQGSHVHLAHYTGDRTRIRQQAAHFALSQLIHLLTS